MDKNTFQDKNIKTDNANFLRAYCRDILDFPKKGVIFRDITNLLKDRSAFTCAIDSLASYFSGEKVDLVASIEARGFILGSAIAYKLGAGFVPIRKSGKLPWNTHKTTYDLEYGQDTLEIHQDAIAEGQRVLVVDDVLATGGTAKAVIDLVKYLKGDMVGMVFLIELLAFKGRSKLGTIPVHSLIQY